MEQWLTDFVIHFGYFAVAIGVGMESMGIPLPGETALLVGAVFAGHGELSPIGVGLAGWGGAVVGDNIGYLIGRRWGRRLITLPVIRRLYRAEHLEAAERFFEKRGWLAVFFGRFVALLRIFAGPLAGMHHMPWRRFVVANAAGGLVWVSIVVTVGLLLGSNLDHAIQLMKRSGYIGLGLVVLIVAIAVLKHRWQKRLVR